MTKRKNEPFHYMPCNHNFTHVTDTERDYLVALEQLRRAAKDMREAHTNAERDLAAMNAELDS